MLLCTENEWKEALLKIKGVKKVNLASRFPGQVIVNVRYKFWSKRVHDFIYRQKSYNVDFRITSRKEK